MLLFNIILTLVPKLAAYANIFSSFCTVESKNNFECKAICVFSLRRRQFLHLNVNVYGLDQSLSNGVSRFTRIVARGGLTF